MCYPPRDEARAKRRRKARATRVALNYGCRRKCSGERAWTHGRWRVGSGGRKLFPSRRERGGDSTTREARKVSRAFRERRKKGGDQTPRAPRMLSSDRRASNYSSAHLTRMNDIVKVSSSARGSARGIAGDCGVGPVDKTKNGCGTCIRSGLHPDVTR